MADCRAASVAPTKALCHEKCQHWRQCFDALGIRCESITGDSDAFTDFRTIQPYHILVMTPEKWDLISRRWTEYPQFMHTIRLFMIDEVHLLNEERRGATLETVVTRMNAIVNV